jgi:hypothetical protein
LLIFVLLLIENIFMQGACTCPLVYNYDNKSHRKKKDVNYSDTG